jgi:hypothetical protein
MTAESIKKNTLQTLQPKNPRTKKIIELKTNNPNLSTTQIGKMVDCSHVNVVHVLQRYGIIQQEVTDFTNNRANVLAGLQHRLLNSVTDEDIKKAPLGTRVLAAAQLYDKERIERGLSNGDQPIMVIIRDKPQPVQVEGKVVDIPKVEQDNLLITPET